MIRLKIWLRTGVTFYLFAFSLCLPFHKNIKQIEEINEPLTELITINEQVQVAENVPDDIESLIDDLPQTPEEVTVQQEEIPITREPLRPGLTAVTYSLQIEPNGDSFTGTLVVLINLDVGTQEEPIRLYAGDLTVTAVYFGITTIVSPLETGFTLEDGILVIEVPIFALSYFFQIEYVGQIRNDGTGLYRGLYDEGASSYLAMNLYPTHARRVFPCVDEPAHTAALSLTVLNNNAYGDIVSNALNEGDTAVARFSPLSTATHLWGFVAHDFLNINIPGDGLRLYVRQNLGSTQHSYAAIMTQELFRQLNDYTQKPYSEIDANSEESCHIFAMPDITRDWTSLSSVGIWEPNMLMNEVHAIRQQKDALVAMASAYSRQWFGYVIFPQNWRYSWIIKGLQLHVAYEVADEADPALDMNAVFVSEVMHEAMYYDAYADVLPLEGDEDLYEEESIREHLNGVIKSKAPAIMRMLKYALEDDNDYIKIAAEGLLQSRSLQNIIPLHFFDAINSQWPIGGTDMIETVSDFLNPWLYNSGYPVITITTSTSGNTVIVTQERFSYTNLNQVIYNVPLTFATKINPDFDNLNPSFMLDASGFSFTVFLDEEDWIIFNIQGSGYYRVNYDFDLWERLIWSLEDPEQRSVIHPLNRAQLVDDALNLARADRLEYDIAFQVVLTMEHETDYSVWKSFIRNMEFLRKRLVVLDEDDYDFDIYMRMVRRSIVAVERDLGFSPDPLINEDAMVSMTRGLVMEHACRSLYQPCVAAAIDWFYDPSGGDPSINPNIPSDLRPAVYCTMVREGGDDVRELLWDAYDNQNVQWEKIVILQSLACSEDQGFILSYLQETILSNTRFGTEERSLIFKAIVESNAANAEQGFRFLQANVNAVTNMYGGSDKLEEILFTLAHNMVDHDMTNNFVNWVTSTLTDLGPSTDIAMRAANHAMENLIWNDMFLEAVYEWIDENSAAGITASIFVLFAGLIAAFMNL